MYEREYIAGAQRGHRNDQKSGEVSEGALNGFSSESDNQTVNQS